MIETIKKRIEENRAELAILQAKHDAMVADFNNKVGLNQNRFNQLSGAIAELELLLNQEDKSQLNEVNRLNGPNSNKRQSASK
jgi:hypothetical protein